MEVYPVNTDPVIITKPAGIWGGFTSIQELVPAGVLPKCILYEVAITNISDTGIYQAALYSGGAGAERHLVQFPIIATEKKEAIARGDGSCGVEAGTRISIAIDGDMAAAATMKAYLRYQPHYMS